MIWKSSQLPLSSAKMWKHARNLSMKQTLSFSVSVFDARISKPSPHCVLTFKYFVLVIPTQASRMMPRKKRPLGLNQTTTVLSSLMRRLLFASTRIGSTAFRVSVLKCPTYPSFRPHILTLDGYFGIAELSKEQREALSKSKRIANPGCYPTGFIALTRPLVDAGLLPAGTPVTVNAISGYSGGGKGLMKIFETEKHEPWGTYGKYCSTAYCAAPWKGLSVFSCSWLTY